jgi:hypothetical protein
LFFLQRLHEHFKTEQYPSRTVKESLAEELGITSRQVCTPSAMIFQLDARYGYLEFNHLVACVDDRLADGLKLGVVSQEQLLQRRASIKIIIVLRKLIAQW